MNTFNDKLPGALSPALLTAESRSSEQETISQNQDRSWDDGLRVPPTGRWHHPLRTIGELLVVLFVFVLTLPIVVFSYLIVRCTSRGSGIYSQKRVGLNGECFLIFKLRTMYEDCERSSGPIWSEPSDPRITPVGRFLRSTHLDELPQLWNVLRGDMTLVGPRPERPEFVAKLEAEIPGYRERESIRPGLTGLAQIQLPPDTEIESVRRKLAYDLYYIREADPLLDLKIVLATGFKVAGLTSRLYCRWLRIPIALDSHPSFDSDIESRRNPNQVQHKIS